MLLFDETLALAALRLAWDLEERGLHLSVDLVVREATR